jgi:hypothetical protein
MPFQCMLDKCPKDSEQCHLWWEIPWENKETGEVQFKKGCILSQEISLPIIQDIVRSAHISSEHSSKLNNQIHDGFVRLGKLAVMARQKHEQLDNSGNLQKKLQS